MDHESENAPNGSAPTIEDELRNWKPSVYHDVAEAEARGQSARQLDEQRTSNRRRTALILFGSFLVVGVAVLLVFWFLKERNEVETPGTTTSVVKTPIADTQNAQLNVGKTENGENYKKTEASVVKEGQEILKLVKYDFYSSKFIVNNTALKKEKVMVATLESSREQLKDSWILIFASASVEGYEDHNLELCGRRLYAVRELLAGDAGIKAQGYWGILAGEFKIDLKGVAPERREDEENRLAQERGEKWLSDQRRLIVITITETVPLSAQARERVPFVVAKYVYDKGMLPKDYDAPDSTPFLLTRRSIEADKASNSGSPTP